MNTRTFETIANQCGALLEVDRKTETSILTEAKIRVQATGISSIPQTVSLKTKDNWISIQLTPLFTIYRGRHTYGKGRERDTNRWKFKIGLETKRLKSQEFSPRVANSGHLTQHHYTINKKVTWAPSSIALHNRSKPLASYLHTPSNTISIPISGPQTSKWLTKQKTMPRQRISLKQFQQATRYEKKDISSMKRMGIDITSMKWKGSQ